MKREELSQCNQLHLQDYIETLNQEEKTVFENELAHVDIQKINYLYQTLVGKDAEDKSDKTLTPLKAFRGDADKLQAYYSTGLNAIKRGEIAVLLLAGGQGSRLGHNGPKGTYNLGVSGANSLFEIQANCLKSLYEISENYIEWHIMTSHINHEDTLEFFEQNSYFNYPKNRINFFKQGSIEAVDDAGRLMLASKTKLVKSPDGNGGCIKALHDYHIVDDLINKGVKWLFIYNVDNAITSIADPTFIGYAIAQNKPVSVKVVPKCSPDEKVGIPCLVEGKPTIVEYTEIGEKRANMKDQDGSLIYDGANIGNYVLSLSALKDVLEKPLNYHLAHKKIPHVNLEGEYILPLEPNGYKFELFIFDIFKSFDAMSVYEGVREEDFAPVKNKQGKDSPETARVLYRKKMQRRK